MIDIFIVVTLVEVLQCKYFVTCVFAVNISFKFILKFKTQFVQQYIYAHNVCCCNSSS